MTGQPSPRPSQLEPTEPSTVGTSSRIEDDSELQQPSFSIATKDQADENDIFQLAPSLLSMPLGTREQTGRSIETGRRALEDQPLGRPCQGNLGNVLGSDPLEEPSALDLNDVSLPSFDDSVSQSAPDADEEDPRVRGNLSNLELVVI